VDSYIIPIYKGKGDIMKQILRSETTRTWHETVGKDTGRKIKGNSEDR